MLRRRIDKFRHYDVVIYAARGSHSARRLASSLSCRRWRDDLPSRYVRRRPYFRGNSSPLVVNWGSTRHPDWLDDSRFRIRPNWLNSAKAVVRAIDKREFFKAIGNSDIPALRSTEDRNEALQWLKKGYRVVARKTTTGSGGTGIVVVEPGAETLLAAPLYTRYYPKTHEFRAHIWKGQLIDFTQKKLKGGPDDSANRLIRSHDNNWVFAHSDLSVDRAGIDAMAKASIDCIRALSLDFGAVDLLAILKGGKLESFRICEVNTGPGLENTDTIRAYTKAILQEKQARL